jgi:transcription elongation GreA/GreB family factor
MPELRPGEVRYVTPEGHRALLDELARVGSASRRGQVLSALLPLLTVHAPACEGRVVFGCWVTLQDEEGRRAVWRLVGPDEADLRERRLGISSPLARELIGKEPGDVVQVDLPRGSAEYEILSVSGQAP